VAQFERHFPSVAEAAIYLAAVTARLKPCPCKTNREVKRSQLWLGYNKRVGPGCCMWSSHGGCRLLAVVLIFSGLALAGDPPRPRISQINREDIVHAFNEELVYIRTSFPMGRSGLRLKDGNLSPSGTQLQQLLALWGPAVKPGDRARISDVFIKDDHIRFEINGGPVKKQKWYQHITVIGADSSVPLSPSDSSANSRGSFVDLYFDKYVPQMTGPELKLLLRPVFDFDSKTAVEAYLESVTPQIKEAIKNHHVLVGMNHEMVIYAMGRPPKKIRERADEVDFEEWIYGTPPENVDFVRFVGDEVVRVETMKVDGQKVVRVEKEVDLGAPTVAKKQDQQQQQRPANAPTLRRPGEEMPEPSSANPSGLPPIAPPPAPDPGPNWNLPPTPTMW